MGYSGKIKMVCCLCGGKAVCRDSVPLLKGNKKVYLLYCKDCRHAGLVFGLLDRSELEEIK
jgi:hypothetical protein